MQKKIIISSLLFILITLLMISGVTENIDLSIYYLLADTASFPIISMASGISFFASATFLLIASILLLFILPTNKQRKYIVIDLAISALAIVISKNIFARPRPLLGQTLLTGSYSYPSGHSFAAITYYGFLFYLVSKSDLSDIMKIGMEILLGFLIVLIPLTRIVLGVHYVSDVVAGVLLGVVFLSLFIVFYEKNKKSVKETPLLETFSYAIQGICHTFKHERNMMIHGLMICLVIVAGILFQISLLEWFVCLLLFGIIISLELVNTAIENVVDLVTEEKKSKAKIAKDAAAGAVFVMAMIAVILGCMIFLPKLSSMVGKI